MMVDLTVCSDVRIEIPMDMITMSEVYSLCKLNCPNYDRLIASLMHERGVTVYSVGSFFFCSKSEVCNSQPKNKIPKELKEIVDLLIDNEMSLEEIEYELAINQSVCINRLNKLLGLDIIKKRSSKTNSDIFLYSINEDFFEKTNPESDNFYTIYSNV